MRETFASLVSGLASDLKDLASTVAIAELLRAVRKGNLEGITHWGGQCSRAELDSRCAPHCVGHPFALCATPLWLAVYNKNVSMVEALLQSMQGSDEATKNIGAAAVVCPGAGHSKDCTVGGLTVLHLACTRDKADCVAKLLSLGASSSQLLCFPVDEVDEPEWDEEKDVFSAGLSGLNALQLAAVRSDDRMCTLLLAHGADASSLTQLPSCASTSLPAALAPKLLPVRSEDGEELECPICYEPLLRLNSEWTPCCARPFHAHCLSRLSACPLCRSSFYGSDDSHTPGHRAMLVNGELAAAIDRAMQLRSRRPPNSLDSTSNHDEALELAFRGPWFENGSAGNHPGPSNYGTRNFSRGPY